MNSLCASTSVRLVRAYVRVTASSIWNFCSYSTRVAGVSRISASRQRSWFVGFDWSLFTRG